MHGTHRSYADSSGQFEGGAPSLRGGRVGRRLERGHLALEMLRGLVLALAPSLRGDRVGRRLERGHLALELLRGLVLALAPSLRGGRVGRRLERGHLALEMLRGLLVAALALGAAQMAAAAELEWLDEEPEFLPVDEAFALSTETAEDGALLAYWDMPDGYYLYRHRFDFTLKDPKAATLGAAELPPGKDKVDEYFGAVEVYYHRAQARVPIRNAQGPVEVGISYQGCAEAGLCYPPERRWVVVNAALSPPAASTADSAPTLSAPATEEQRLASALAERGLLLAMALFFIGGIGLAFTPCVLPMVPILSSIIVGDTETPTRWRAFSLSLAYVLGMAFTYAAVGTLMGLFGASLNLQAALQSPPVLIVFAALFALLSLAMFGFYELRLPQRWQNALDGLGGRVGGGKHLGVLVMGALSALVVSPCVSAPVGGGA